MTFFKLSLLLVMLLLIVILIFIVIEILSGKAINVTTDDGKYNYCKIIEASLLFYEAQRSGRLPASNRVPWRGDSMLQDKTPDGQDLTGGYFDAGDYVKFGFPAAAMTTLIAWGVIDFEKAYEKAGQLDNVKDMLKWSTDYFIKCHTSEYEFYGQVGDGDIDHSYVGRPEDYPYESKIRPAWKIDANNSGSDLVGETAAALAAVSIVFNESEPDYSQLLLNHAKELYKFAFEQRGLYSDSILDSKKFYQSSDYKDELVWAAAWLYLATNDQKYLNDATQLYDQLGLNWVATAFDWDCKVPGVQVLLYKLTQDNKYKENAEKFVDYLLNKAKRTPKGLVLLREWGSLRHAANVAFIALQTAKEGIGNTEKIKEFAKSQIGYILGDTGRSFVVGVGKNPPTHPHHRPSACPSPPKTCDWNTFKSKQPNPHVLTGALVGGPDENDNYKDDRADYMHNEVALDYNAGFQSALAALLQMDIDT